MVPVPQLGSFIAYTAKAGMLQPRVGRGFHAGAHPVTLAVRCITQKRSAPHHAFRNTGLIGIVALLRTGGVERNGTGE